MQDTIVTEKPLAQQSVIDELCAYDVTATRVQDLLGDTTLVPRDGRPDQVIRYAGRIVVRPHRRTIHIELTHDAPASALSFYERMLEQVRAGMYDPSDRGAWVDNASGTRSWSLELGQRMTRRSADLDAKTAERWETCSATECDGYRGVHPIWAGETHLHHETIIAKNQRYEIALVSSDEQGRWNVDLAVHDGMDADEAVALIRDYSRAWERCKRLNGVSALETAL